MRRDIDPADVLRLGPLEDSLGLMLRLGQLQAFDRFFAHSAAEDLTPASISALILIAENPGVRQGHVAKRLMIKRANMAKMVKLLETKGLVDRTVPSGDRRAVELRLTAQGQDRLERITAICSQAETDTRSRLDPEEARMLTVLLRRFVGLPDRAGGNGL